MKILAGEWKWDEKVTLEIDGKVITRKVKYGSLDGLYITYKNEKIGYGSFEDLTK